MVFWCACLVLVCVYGAGVCTPCMVRVFVVRVSVVRVSLVRVWCGYVVRVCVVREWCGCIVRVSATSVFMLVCDAWFVVYYCGACMCSRACVSTS